MKINFNELKEIRVSNMNDGNGIVKSKMFISDDCKIIKAIGGNIKWKELLQIR